MNTYRVTLVDGKSFEIERKNVMDATTSAVSMSYFKHNGAEIVKIEKVGIEWLDKRVIWRTPDSECNYHGKIVGIDGESLLVKDIISVERIHPSWISHIY